MLRTATIGLASICTMATLFAAAEPVEAQDFRAPGVMRPEVLQHVRPTCPDPAVEKIDFRILSKTTQFRGEVLITGTVRNLGSEYVSAPHQQSVLLYEGNTLVANQPFHNLSPNQTAQVAYKRNWNASSPSEGEFPPTYKAVIIYDPDITKDGNPKNDDCRWGNNQLERSGMDINALFTSPGPDVRPHLGREMLQPVQPRLGR